MQRNSSQDSFGAINKMFKENGIIETRKFVQSELFQQYLIYKEEVESVSRKISNKNSETMQVPEESGHDEIRKLCKQFVRDGKSSSLDWVQRALLETCFAKIYYEKISTASLDPHIYVDSLNTEIKIMNFELFKNNEMNAPIPCSVCYHSFSK